jgi:uncharacterized short protein YbdD (DUF466 family)
MRRATRRTATTAGGWFARAARVCRAILGAPDYERYLAHMRERHPQQTPLSREEFARQRLEERYNKPGTRCC